SVSTWPSTPPAAAPPSVNMGSPWDNTAPAAAPMPAPSMVLVVLSPATAVPAVAKAKEPASKNWPIRCFISMGVLHCDVSGTSVSRRVVPGKGGKALLQHGEIIAVPAYGLVTL